MPFFIVIYAVLLAVDLYGTYYGRISINQFSTPALDLALLCYFLFQSRKWHWNRQKYLLIGFLVVSLFANFGYLHRLQPEYHIFAEVCSIIMQILIFCYFWFERTKLEKRKVISDLVSLMPFSLILILIFGFTFYKTLPPSHVLTSAIISIFYLVLGIIIISRKVNEYSYRLVFGAIILFIGCSLISTFGMYISEINHHQLIARATSVIGMLLTILGILEENR